MTNENPTRDRSVGEDRENRALQDRDPVDRIASDKPISPQDPSSMPRAEDDPIVFERSPEFHDRPGQGSPGDDERREDWQKPTDPGSGRPSRTTPENLDDVEEDDPARPGRKPNPTGLQA